LTGTGTTEPVSAILNAREAIGNGHLYAVSFGLPAMPLVNGSATQGGSLPVLPVCQVGGIPASLTFAGLIVPGLYQLKLTSPAATANEDNALGCSYGGLTTPAGI
jgi:uncharacterized protein (TIGR03437 family)